MVRARSKSNLDTRTKKEIAELVRDIDDWMFHFERRAAPRLKRMFTADLGELPGELARLLEKLRRASEAVEHRRDRMPLPRK